MTELINRVKNTEDFLKCISQHLNGRADCRKLTYRIAIGVEDEQLSQHRQQSIDCDLIQKRICFSPGITVFPDIYHRKQTDKISIVAHVASAHFGAVLDDYYQEGCTFLDTSKFVRGVYEYQASIDRKKRRWVRVESIA